LGWLRMDDGVAHDRAPRITVVSTGHGVQRAVNPIPRVKKAITSTSAAMTSVQINHFRRT
jgi:hypothetical protein